MDEKKILNDFLDNFFLIYPNISDTFWYASADTERIYVDGYEEGKITNQSMLVDIYLKYGATGITAYCSKMRGMEPIQPLRTEKYYKAMKFLENWEYESD